MVARTSLQSLPLCMQLLARLVTLQHAHLPACLPACLRPSSRVPRAGGLTHAATLIHVHVHACGRLPFSILPACLHALAYSHVAARTNTQQSDMLRRRMYSAAGLQWGRGLRVTNSPDEHLSAPCNTYNTRAAPLLTGHSQLQLPMDDHRHVLRCCCCVRQGDTIPAASAPLPIGQLE